MTQYEGSGEELTELGRLLERPEKAAIDSSYNNDLTMTGAILRDYMMGKIKLSKQSLRELEKQVDKARRVAERKLKPKAKRPGHREHLRKIWRKGQRKWRDKNPDYEYGLNRRYTRLLKHCRERGIECTLTLAEFEVLLEGVTPDMSIRITRKDLSKGFSFENTVVLDSKTYFKLLALRNKQRR